MSVDLDQRALPDLTDLSFAEVSLQIHLEEKMHLTVVGALAIGVLAVGAAIANAQPPKHGDPSLAAWFNSLSAPDGTPCCSMADCRRTKVRLTTQGYETLIDDTWVAVPWDRVLTRTDNPTGQAVVCTAPQTKIILCFVRAPET
jgi:hypothetical protein